MIVKMYICKDVYLEKEMKTIFNYLDHDEDGFLSRNDIKIVMSDISPELKNDGKLLTVW